MVSKCLLVGCGQSLQLLSLSCIWITEVMCLCGGLNSLPVSHFYFQIWNLPENLLKWKVLYTFLILLLWVDKLLVFGCGQSTLIFYLYPNYWSHVCVCGGGSIHYLFYTSSLYYATCQKSFWSEVSKLSKFHKCA